MDRHWLRPALVVGLVYFVVGRLFAIPASHVRSWRLAAWVVSGVAFAAQIAYEHFRLRSSPRPLAFHAAAAAAVGACALAVAGFLHSLGTTAPTALWALALVAWPIVTAVPAFVVALILGIVLARAAPRTRA